MPGWAIAYVAFLLLASGLSAALQLRRGLGRGRIVGNLLAAAGLALLALTAWTPWLARALGRGALVIFLLAFGWTAYSTSRDFLDLQRDPETGPLLRGRMEWTIVLLTALFYAPAAAIGALAVERAWEP
ncbi:MAG TPA: hypothetical protein VNK43_12180 [Gemmatimonadales bacterium]|nr:hypothetical protein [Gemmatimonadales bacterium]